MSHCTKVFSFVLLLHYHLITLRVVRLLYSLWVDCYISWHKVIRKLCNSVDSVSPDYNLTVLAHWLKQQFDRYQPTKSRTINRFSDFYFVYDSLHQCQPHSLHFKTKENDGDALGSSPHLSGGIWRICTCIAVVVWFWCVVWRHVRWPCASRTRLLSYTNNILILKVLLLNGVGSMLWSWSQWNLTPKS